MDQPTNPPVDTPVVIITTPPPKKHFKPLIPLFILLGFLPVAIAAVLVRQNLSGQAAVSTRPCTRIISSVRIHPGQIATFVKSPPVYLSTLAYDKQNNPIYTGVTYEWGISSSATIRSIGQLIPNRQIATFIPQNPGSGDIFVRATSSCGEKITGSIPVTVSAPSFTSIPTPTPTR